MSDHENKVILEDKKTESQEINLPHPEDIKHPRGYVHKYLRELADKLIKKEDSNGRNYSG